MLRIIVPLLIVAGGIWAIVYYVYPYMKANTSHPILFTVLLVFATMLINFAFSMVKQDLLGMFVVGDLLKIIIKR